MRIVAIALLFILTTTSCNSDRPGDLLPADKMEAVIADLYMAEAYSTMVNDSLHQVHNRNMDSLAVYYRSILTHHNVSAKQLDESIDWYKRNPEELDTLYARIIPDLSKVQGMYPKK